MIDYRGKRVLISGAASGIGRGLARAFAERGATLELLDHNDEALRTVVEELRPDRKSTRLNSSHT